jgi:hypothetical protein
VLPFPLCRPDLRQDSFVEPDLEGDGSAVFRYVKLDAAATKVRWKKMPRVVSNITGLHVVSG